MPAQWFHGQIATLDKINEGKIIVQLQVDDAEALLPFKPGQFVTMDLPLGDKRRDRWRSYSIASIPSQLPILEFAISRLPEGLASTFFFEQAKLGMKIKFKAPDGNFTLPKASWSQHLWICTGTGVVPFIAMLRQLGFEKNSTYAPIHLIYGARKEADLLYKTELDALVEELDLKVSYTLSQPSENWEGSKGYVHDVYRSAYPVLNETSCVMLCGWSKMIDEALLHLQNMVPNLSKQVKYELYG